MDENCEFLYAFLSAGLDRLVHEALQDDERAISQLSILFQRNLPLIMMADCEEYDELLQTLRRDALRDHLDGWLQWAITDQLLESESTGELIYRIIYVFLVEMRLLAYERKKGVIATIADALHTLPLDIALLKQGGTLSTDKMNFWKDKAEELKLGFQ